MSDSQALQQTGDGAPPAQVSVEGVEDALLDGDLSKLSPQQRLDYYEKVCESVGLNPLTKPFEYIRLNGQLTLYAKRDAAEQLRAVHGISITDLEENWRDSLCIFRAYAKTEDGRTDVATGAVDTSRDSGQDLANSIMKAETKAKRRVTLSLAGLGWLDETEVSDIPDQATEEVNVDYDTGEVKTRKAEQWYEQATDWLVRQVEGGAEASNVLANAGSVPSEHPIDDWPEAKAETAISRIKQAAADREDVAAEEAQALGKASGTSSTKPSEKPTKGSRQSTSPTTSRPQDEGRYEDATEALQAHFDAAWADGKEDWEAISEAQLNRLYAIADDEGWDEAALNRLVKDELGWESKADVPYGEPYEEICQSLEDERLRYHMSRDPDTPDMFEEDDSQEASDPAFEDGAEDDDLPF